MRGRSVLVGVLAMFGGRCRVLLGLIVLVELVMMRRLVMMMRRRVVMGGRLMVMFACRMLRVLGHLLFPSQEILSEILSANRSRANSRITTEQ
jgi:hypothetical protein